jgi:SAM-dependent methyltransferase
MEDTNKKTIESYETSINEYIQNTPNKRGGAVLDWIGKSIQMLKPTDKILEIGSAYGRDAKIIEEKGLHVEKTYATKGFVKILQRHDPTAHILNIITDDIDDGYDLIIANAVFLHFNDNETQSTTKKVYNALNPGGIFSLTLKQGGGETWRNNKSMPPRYFNYWSKEDIVELLTNTGFTNINA